MLPEILSIQAPFAEFQPSKRVIMTLKYGGGKSFNLSKILKKIWHHKVSMQTHCASERMCITVSLSG